MAFGEPNVDAFLASVPAGTVEGWLAYYQLEPWGDDWDRSSMIAVQVVNTIAALATGLAGGRETHEPLPNDAFVPYRKHRAADADRLDKTLKTLQQAWERRGS